MIPTMTFRHKALFLIVFSACSATKAEVATDSHPPEFVGRWLLENSDRTWTDTLEFRQDGSITGVGKSLPGNSTWLSRQSTNRVQFCLRAGNQAACYPYRRSGDTLELAYPGDPIRYRRISDL
jgi:hypothetical protein